MFLQLHTGAGMEESATSWDENGTECKKTSATAKGKSGRGDSHSLMCHSLRQ